MSTPIRQSAYDPCMLLHSMQCMYLRCTSCILYRLLHRITHGVKPRFSVKPSGMAELSCLPSCNPLADATCALVRPLCNVVGEIPCCSNAAHKIFAHSMLTLPINSRRPDTTTANLCAYIAAPGHDARERRRNTNIARWLNQSPEALSRLHMRSIRTQPWRLMGSWTKTWATGAGAGRGCCIS